MKSINLGRLGILFLLVMALILVKWPNLITRLAPELPSLSSVAPKSLSAEDVLGQINTYRTENKMLALKKNEKLDRAALARLRIIRTDNDFNGDKTGVTLANAAKNNGYSYSLIGDMYAENVTGETKFTEKVLGDGRFRDVGIAIEQVGPGWNVMVILGRQASAPTEKTGAGGYPQVNWGGPELWEAVNKRRVEMGVNPLSRRDELCTIASIRLNQLLELTKLDGHAGLDPLLNREDLKWIREKYNLSEFLIVGYPTPLEAVYAWEHTLGHRALMAGGEYVWGCVYAQNTFGVAIAAY